MYAESWYIGYAAVYPRELCTYIYVVLLIPLIFKSFLPLSLILRLFN